MVVLSDDLWRTGYGSDPGILGRTVQIDGAPHTVVGVMPSGYNAPGEWVGAAVQVALWRPFRLDAKRSAGEPLLQRGRPHRGRGSRSKLPETRLRPYTSA